MATVAASEELLRIVFSFLIVTVEACGGLVIATGVIRAIVGYVRTCGRGRRSRDITGLSPTREDILLLSAIIALRTVTNTLLERELALLGPDCPAFCGALA